MTPLELPQAVRRAIYWLALLVGVVAWVAGHILGDHAPDVWWFRGIDGLDAYLLVLVGAVAASHTPGKAVTPGGDEVLTAPTPVGASDTSLDGAADTSLDPQVSVAD